MGGGAFLNRNHRFTGRIYVKGRNRPSGRGRASRDYFFSLSSERTGHTVAAYPALKTVCTALRCAAQRSYRFSLDGFNSGKLTVYVRF
jgi:hypothetical protein